MKSETSETERLLKENNYLRGLIPKLTGKCLHCGLENMGECASGFPGCAWADDLFIAGEDTLQALRTQLKSVEAERDRYKLALNRLLEGDHVGTPINRGCGAMSVIEDALSWTDAEVDQFIKEWDEWKHQLSPEDERALEKSKVKLFERIKSTLNSTNNQKDKE